MLDSPIPAAEASVSGEGACSGDVDFGGVVDEEMYCGGADSAFPEGAAGVQGAQLFGAWAGEVRRVDVAVVFGLSIAAVHEDHREPPLQLSEFRPAPLPSGPNAPLLSPRGFRPCRGWEPGRYSASIPYRIPLRI